MAGPVMLVWHSSPCPIDFTRIVIVGGRKVAEMHGVKIERVLVTRTEA